MKLSKAQKNFRPKLKLKLKRDYSLERAKKIERGELPLKGKYAHVKNYKMANIKGKVFNVRGTWEANMANTLNRLKILWVREKYLRYRNKQNELRTYTPDFYLPKYDVYIEVKGEWTPEAELKMKLACKHEKVKIRIYKEDNMELLYAIKDVGTLIAWGFLFGASGFSKRGHAFEQEYGKFGHIKRISLLQ